MPLITAFGIGGRHGQSTSVLISLGLPHAPSFLRAICSIPLFGIAKVAANVCSLEIPTKMPTNRTAAVNFYARFQRTTKMFLENMESNQ
jgi:hypothetical protein